MELHELSMDDLPLYEKLQCDPVMMAELGGPRAKEDMPGVLQNTINYVETGRGWAYKIVSEGTGAGSIGIWESDWDGQPINEIGWMVLPDFQGRGLASQAVRAMLDKAKATERWDVIHAFPGVTNAASNAICRKAGFKQLDECDIDYAGRMLRCNHWVIEVNSL
jgi:RimJ/RimL family protein N-acetyltransferase